MKNLIAAALFVLFTSGPASAGIIKVKVNGLVCDFCAQAIGIMLKRDPSVSGSKINLSSKIVTIKVRNGRKLSDGKINRLITSAGYNVVKIYR